jgi:nitroreductase
MISETIGLHAHPSIIRARLSPRSFSTRTVDIGKLLKLLEAARWTSSYGNEQPWSFVVASRDDRAAHERLLSCLAESNIATARPAPLLILSVVKLNFDADGRRNPYAFHDAGKAASNLTHKAGAMGLLARQMSGFDAARARELFNIPSGFTPVAVIAIGYPGPDSPTGNILMEETSKMRRPLGNLVFADRWGESSPLLLGGAQPDPCDDRDITVLQSKV